MATIECIKERCKEVENRILGLPTTKITQSCKDRLLKLVHSELNFLSRLAAQPTRSGPISTNIGYVEAIVYIVQQPVVNGVSCVCKTIQGQWLERSFSTNLRDTYVDIVGTFNRKPVWFVVSYRNPKYVCWLDKCNRKGLKTRLHLLVEAALATIILQPVSIVLCFANGIEETVAQALKEEFAAREIFDFNHTCFGMQNKTEERLGTQGTTPHIFQDVEDGEWVNILSVNEMCIENGRDVHKHEKDGTFLQNQTWKTFEIKISSFSNAGKLDQSEVSLENGYTQCEANLVNSGELLCLADTCNDEYKHVGQFGGNLSGQPGTCLEDSGLHFDKTFYSLVASMDMSHDKMGNDEEKINLINLDTTALVALVSEVSNGNAKKLLEMSDEDMNKRFKSTSKFMRAQANSELEDPLLEEMVPVLAGKRAVISQYVYNEFMDLISMCGGPHEKRRAEILLNCILILPNNPSIRVMGLPETGRIKLKHKVIFGTGDQWRAPTLTANMGFVRAVMQTGMSLLVLEHRPRALTGLQLEFHILIKGIMVHYYRISVTVRGLSYLETNSPMKGVHKTNSC